MRKIVVFLIFAAVLILIGFLGNNIYSRVLNNKSSVVSPVPDFLTILFNKEVSTLNLWLPSLKNKLSANLKTPEISAQSALIFDITTKEVLYSKNPTEKLPMASLTKIMTAIVALENKKKDDTYVVSKDDLVGEDSMGLDAGEKLLLSELLYGMMLHSGNDAAEVLANNFPGGRAAFVNAMNNKVKALGLSDTSFTNPTGLEGDGKQYTTAYDVVVMTEYALTNFPLFDQVVSTFDYNIPQTPTHKAFYLENETNLLTSYPGVKGVKDGYTPEAGLCLVTYLDYGGHKIVGVVLGSDDRRGEMIELLDYSLRSLGITPPHHG
ncbi:MAG TPA: D-alanyl-D-alanine carboxypeptidase family protein [Patescibacteria group bacterium]|jgi:D-alanyl-D-alanine carboxypeptidase|nr:D-alanyl-D-alanine carboxypeptidase family protein [Patescibacteria group bacterium]